MKPRIAVATEREIIAVGTDAGDPGVWISADGVEWERLGTVATEPDDPRLLGIAAVGDSFVGVGATGDPGELDAAAGHREELSQLRSTPS